ncbi:MAG TPA: secretin and TonB N-terminal domain-containing protein [Candidatus Eremiobacteraceae bacterium]|nr:secretin and TonB N-terminal domain-containing protein [Candidatus Eremiobacteraceae bacterium]
MLRHLRSVSAWLLSSVIAMSSVVAPQPGSAAGNMVTDVSYGKTDGAFTVSVAATGSVSTHVQRLAVDSKQNLQDLVIDVSPASYDGQTKVIGFSSGSIRQVRLGQLSSSPAIMRIVVEAQGTPQYDLKAGAGNKSLTLRLPTSQVAYTLPTAQAVAAARAAQTRQTSALAPKPAVVASKPASKPAVVAVKPAQAPAPQPKPVVHAPPAPKPAVVAAPVASKPVQHPAPKPQTVAFAAPAPSATQNPWLPGGKFYCKVPVKGSHYAPYHHAPGSSVMPSSQNMGPGGSSSYGSASAGTVTLDVKNADIIDVLKVLAEQSGQNIVATQNVKGTTTVDLHNVPLKEALDLIVRTNGLDYRQVGNVYVVGTPGDLSAQFGQAGQVATQSVAFPIKYANPVDLQKQLATVIPANNFTVDARTDTLLVTGTPDIIQSARNFLALSDIPAPQVMFEVKVIDITRTNDTDNTGVNYTGSSALAFLENPLGAPPGTTFTLPATQYLGQPIPLQPFTRNELFIQAQLNYLITHNEAQLLADPKVSALDNLPASILIGQTYPIVYYDPRAGQFQAQFVDIGVKMNITPVINTDGYITTTLHTERSVITGFVQQFPILNKRSADSTLRVKDGETIVLGGMIDDEMTKSISKIPLLGDIPVFGVLFKNINTTKLHNEVVFLITPHIINERQ